MCSASKWCFLVFAVFASSCCYKAEADKILAVLPWPGRSHYIVSSALMKALAQKGHEVTVISPFPQEKPLANFRDIAVPSVAKAMLGDIKNLYNWYKMDVVTSYLLLFDMGYRATEATLLEPAVQELLRSNQTFDAVICEVFLAEALYGFSERFNAPLIGFSSLGAVLWNTDMVGSPSPPSYVPHFMLPFTERMTLWERIANLAFLNFERLYSDLVFLPQQAALYNQHFPNAKRSMYEVRKTAALMLMNQHVSYSYSRPYMPNQVEVGGMHINRKRSPLPADIAKFIDEAKHGVIYFSMGSNLKSKDLPLETRKTILDTFRSLKQRVLWKFEEPNLADKPENVLIRAWFPQDDILAHPNVKVFITHGGLVSTTETLYHGKPVIGIPIFGDQFLNMNRAVRSGYGIILDYTNITYSNFKTAIDRMFTDTSYTEKVQAISNRFRDQPVEPLDLAIYWVEHVLRHKGAQYMHCAGLDLNFIQYHNLDAIFILYGGLLLFLGGIIWCSFYMCCRKSKSVKAKKIKRQKAVKLS